MFYQNLHLTKKLMLYSKMKLTTRIFYSFINDYYLIMRREYVFLNSIKILLLNYYKYYYSLIL